MTTYEVKYTRPGLATVQSTRVRASSPSQAKEELKARWNGQITIISVVER